MRRIKNRSCGFLKKNLKKSGGLLDPQTPVLHVIYIVFQDDARALKFLALERASIGQTEIILLSTLTLTGGVHTWGFAELREQQN